MPPIEQIKELIYYHKSALHDDGYLKFDTPEIEVINEFNLFRKNPMGKHGIPKDCIWVSYFYKDENGETKPLMTTWMDLVLAGSTDKLLAWLDKISTDKSHTKDYVRRIAMQHLTTLLGTKNLTTFAKSKKQEMIDCGVQM